MCATTKSVSKLLTPIRQRDEFDRLKIKSLDHEIPIDIALELLGTRRPCRYT
jgi:hypothetical protein